MKLTMEILNELNFEIIRSYPHDNYITQVWMKNNLKVERTFDTSKHYTIVSEEVIIGNASFELKNSVDLLILDDILNK